MLCDDDHTINRLFRWCCNLVKKHFEFSSSKHSLVGKNCHTPNAAPVRHRLDVLPVADFSSQPLTQLGPFSNYVNSGSLNLAADGFHVFSSAVNLNSLSSKERAFLEHALVSNEIMPKELMATSGDVSAP